MNVGIAWAAPAGAGGVAVSLQAPKSARLNKANSTAPTDRYLRIILAPLPFTFLLSYLLLKLSLISPPEGLDVGKDGLHFCLA
jgi:hypothetical protein